MLIDLEVPDELHPETRKLVAGFAKALAEKLCAAEKKYGYSDGWLSPDWEQECRLHFLAHIGKGDPRDVAAYCAFMWKHGWPTIAEPFEPHLPPGIRALMRDLKNAGGSDNGGNIRSSFG